jgi:Plasmid encoded RepA protein
MSKARKGLTHISEALPGLLPPGPQAPAAPAKGQLPAKRPEPEPSLDLITGEAIRSEDIAYTHSLFLQCFMPIRHNAKNRQQWEAGNRNAKLLIRAGILIKPNSPGTFKNCIVPAGPKARLILAYINDYAYRHNTPVIPLGDSMRQAMQRMEIAIGGANAKELQRELENLAAADMLIGVWTPDGSAHQHKTAIAEELSFWIEKDLRQGTFWQQEMTLSPTYFGSLKGPHMAPLHWPAYIALQSKPRAMDIFAFLQYRLRNPLKAPAILHVSILHAMFGQDIKDRKSFWQRFKQSLVEALKWYPTARVEILNDAIKLYNSPPLIPYRKIGRIGS